MGFEVEIHQMIVSFLFETRVINVRNMLFFNTVILNINNL